MELQGHRIGAFVILQYNVKLHSIDLIPTSNLTVMNEGDSQQSPYFKYFFFLFPHLEVSPSLKYLKLFY